MEEGVHLLFRPCEAVQALICLRLSVGIFLRALSGINQRGNEARLQHNEKQRKHVNCVCNLL